MGAVAQPDLAAFRARYVVFATLAPTLYDAYFAEATLYHANDGSGPVRDAGQQLALLHMLTAHIAALGMPGPDGQPSSLVGPITSASEGSVSVGSGLIVEPGTAGWLQQTPYGAAYLAATAAYRSARYVPGPAARGSGAYGFGYGRGW